MADKKVKRLKVHQVSKELKVESPTLLEFLESCGYDVSRKLMQPVDEEMYVELLRRFDPHKYQKYQSDMVLAEEETKKSASIKLREEELKKILDAKKPEEISRQKKFELPSFQMKVVEKAPIVKAEAAKSAAETKRAKKEAGLKAITPEKAPSGKKKDSEVEVPVVADSDKAKLKKKIELPKSKELKVLEQPAKKPKKLKRKRIVPKDETAAEAAETAVTTKYSKDKAKGKPKIKKAALLQAPGPAGKRRKRGRRTQGAPVGAATKPGRGRKRRKVDKKEVAATIKQTMAKMTEHGRSKRRYARGQGGEEEIIQESTIKIAEFITTQELANYLEIPVQEIIKQGLEMGTIMSINQRLDRDLIELLAAEFSVDIEFIQEELVDDFEDEINEENLVKRHPIVTVMGHVDHGKTTLLDHLRESQVAEGEAGGITQHIGAYEVVHGDDRITFLDTPGHEAFTAMRARGVQVTDIVVLVVAADDKVMPQTLEAIDHAKSAGVPIVIAVNKIDKPNANVEAVYQQLSEHNILVEKWGGKYQAAEISAKFGQGIDDLLAEILVAADLLDLKADPTMPARGIAIETRLDKGLGAVATIVIRRGTLKIGDPFTVGQHYGKVRSMFSESGEGRKEAGPSIPVQVVGYTGVPQAGDMMVVQKSEKIAREVSQRRQRQQREMSYRHIAALTLEQVNRRMLDQELQELPLVIKGDVNGSVEVLADSLMKLSNEEVKVEIVHRAVGGITESDVLLAAASGAIVIGFHVHPNIQAREVARREGVEIRVYRIIHEVIDEIRSSLEGMLIPDKEERYLGNLEVRQVFKVSHTGSIAGSYVTDGKINRHSRVRLLRDDVEVWTGEIASLKRFKDDTREVVSGYECGIMLAGQNDIHVGDRIEAFEIVELARKLEDVV